ncbi:MAG TPA: Gfo/Idh/MocA family oxidoreductase [Anaerolineales bacterium]|nr:Gfo/Idh/MocA family oxidoreductase [Anaerolineales bacterium]
MKVAVIGIGSMGRNHARVYSELVEAELVAVSDADAKLARSVAEKFGARFYADYHELLETEKPEAVSIAVPTVLHEEVGIAALEAGAHVLMEKPIAAKVEEGQRLIAKAQSVGRQLMVGHIIRFNPAIQALKQKLSAGELGRIFQVFCRRAGPFPARIRDVGVVVDLAPHDVDLMRFLTAADPVRVYAETERRIHTDHEDLLWGILRFADGITGSLEINWLTPTKVRETLVLGERGMFRVDDLTQDLYFYENAHAKDVQWATLQALKGVSEGRMTRYAIPRFEPLKAELQAFLKAIEDGKPTPVSGEDGLVALKISLALIESGQNHQVIEF